MMNRKKIKEYYLKMMNKGFNTTNLKKEISELKVANTILRLAVNACQKERVENVIQKESLKAQIKKLEKDNTILQRLIEIRKSLNYA